MKARIRRHWTGWYEVPIAELEHRDAIREQAIGSAYATQRLEVTARYEVYPNRKLARTLAMLSRLRDLRRPTLPGWSHWQKRGYRRLDSTASRFGVCRAHW